MPGDVRAFKRTYGFAATVAGALAVVAAAIAFTTVSLVPAIGAFVVAASLAVLVLAVGAVHRPRAFLVAFGDDAAESERRVLAARVAGAFAVVVALVVLAAGVESILAYRELVRGATGGSNAIP